MENLEYDDNMKKEKFKKVSDLLNNYIPSKIKTIHLIAVCGTGMGALACMLKDMGYHITGSDSAVYPPMSTFLEEKAITVFQGFERSHLDHRPDLVIVGNAVRRDNPEAQRMRELNLPFCSMPQAINGLIAPEKKPILIAGTHGKTTTSSIAAWIIKEAGLDPSFFIGGILKNFNSNYRLGSGEYLVVEGDEYDTAYFDKGPKFLHFNPYVSILTGVEFDHADIFKDIDHVTAAFKQFIANISPHHTLIAYDDNKIVDSLLEDAKCRTMRYGIMPKSDWRLENICVEPPWTMFDVFYHHTRYDRFKTRMLGEHNLNNLLSVIAVSKTLGLPKKTVKDAIASFSGVKRRQEVRGVKKGVTVLDDFAHHPTAVRETIQAVKPFYPSGRLIAVFEPRTNTSMRDVFQSIYPDSFDQADTICIRKPPLLNKIPEGERFSSEKLVADLKQKGKNAYYFLDTEKIIDFLVAHAKANDVILIMSNGGFDNIHEKLLERL